MSMDTEGITIVLHGLSGGGAERTGAKFAEYWNKQGLSVTLVTFGISSDENYAVPSGVTRIALDSIVIPECGLGLWGKEEINIIRLRIALEMAGNKNVLAIMAKMGLRCILANSEGRYRVFVAERTFPEYTLTNIFDMELRKILYPLAAGVVVQTGKDSVAWFKENNIRCIIRVIPNFISEQELYNIDKARVCSHATPYILQCGRLCAQKRHDLIISVFAELISRTGDKKLRLLLVGEGELEAELKNLVAGYGLEDRVEFTGWRADLYSLLKGAVCTTLTSDFEGFPNVVLESLAVGTPVVAFDCVTGPGDIIEHGKNGMLLDSGDMEGFTVAVERLCLNREYRDKLGREALKVRERFSEVRVMRMWNELLWG